MTGSNVALRMRRDRRVADKIDPHFLTSAFDFLRDISARAQRRDRFDSRERKSHG
jgi:hypothetical protein